MPTPVAENKAEHARPVVRPAALPPWPLGTSVPRAQALRRCPEHLFRSVGAAIICSYVASLERRAA